MLDPGRLRGCIEGSAGLDDRSIARKLARVAGKLGALEDERRSVINQYAAEELSGDEYIAANRALDRDQESLIREKAELVASLRSPQQEDFVDASLRQFCAAANARWQARTDDDATRQFIVCHVERVIYNRYQQPLLLGAVGLAIGAGVAASIPITETENKVMGDASDFVRDAVSEKAAKVREMAGAAVDEAKEQGLTPEGAGEALRSIGDKLGAVARPR
jgi:hypothetical protein